MRNLIYETAADVVERRAAELGVSVGALAAQNMTDARAAYAARTFTPNWPVDAMPDNPANPSVKDLQITVGDPGEIKKALEEARNDNPMPGDDPARESRTVYLPAQPQSPDTRFLNVA